MPYGAKGKDVKTLKELRGRVRLAWQILRGSDGNLVSHAKHELKSSYETGDEMNIAMADHLIDMVRVFGTAGHSGFSASYAVSALNTLLKFEPLGPLLGVDSEWVHVGEQNGKPLYQNNRCGRIFKEGDHPYDIDGFVFREPDGGCFTGIHSRTPVTFPYMPKTIFVDVPKDSTREQQKMLAQQALASGSAS